MIKFIVRSVVLASVLVTGAVNMGDNTVRDGYIASGLIGIHVDGEPTPNMYAPGVNESNPLNTVRALAGGTWPVQLVLDKHKTYSPRDSQRSRLYQLAAATADPAVKMATATTPATAVGASSDLAATLALLLHSKGGPSVTVAATGVVSPDGAVLSIAGVAAKVWAAHHGGAEHFLLPKPDVYKLVDVPPGMTIHPVTTVKQAFKVVRDL